MGMWHLEAAESRPTAGGKCVWAGPGGAPGGGAGWCSGMTWEGDPASSRGLAALQPWDCSGQGTGTEERPGWLQRLRQQSGWRLWWLHGLEWS